MRSALALLEEARLEVLDLGLELLDARPVLGLERAVCGWAGGGGCFGRGGGHWVLVVGGGRREREGRAFTVAAVTVAAAACSLPQPPAPR